MERRGIVWLFVWLGLFGFGLSVFLSRAHHEDHRSVSRYSTYRSDGQGARALFLLSQRLGFSTMRVRQALRLVPEGKLLFILDPFRMRENEEKALVAWVERGNTLVLAGAKAHSLFDRFGVRIYSTKKEKSTDKEPKPQPVQPGQDPPAGKKEDPDQGARLFSSMDVGRRLWSPPHAYFSRWPKQSQAIHVQDGKRLVLRVRHGLGTVFACSSAKLFSNDGLPRRANVWFASNILRYYAKGAPVLFDEYHHGYRFSRTFMMYLRHRKLHFFLWQGAIVLFFLLWWATVRFGPARNLPEEQAPQTTGDHIEALAQLYQQAGATGHVASLLADELRQVLSFSVGGYMASADAWASAPEGFGTEAWMPMLQALENAAHGLHVLDEQTLMTYAYQIDQARRAQRALTLQRSAKA